MGTCSHVYLEKSDVTVKASRNKKLLKLGGWRGGWEGVATWRKTCHYLRLKLGLYYQQVPDAKHLGTEGGVCIQFDPHSKQICAI